MSKTNVACFFTFYIHFLFCRPVFVLVQSYLFTGNPLCQPATIITPSTTPLSASPAISGLLLSCWIYLTIIMTIIIYLTNYKFWIPVFSPFTTNPGLLLFPPTPQIFPVSPTLPWIFTYSTIVSMLQLLLLLAKTTFSANATTVIEVLITITTGLSTTTKWQTFHHSGLTFPLLSPSCTALLIVITSALSPLLLHPSPLYHSALAL